MRIYALLVLIGFLFLLSLKSNIAALYTYWWFGIFRPHEWAWNDTLIKLQLTKIAALIFLGSALYNKNIPRIDNPITILIVIFLILEMLATWINGCPDAARRTVNFFDLAKLIVVVLLTTEILTKKSVIGWLIAIIALSIGFHSGKGGIWALITRADYYDSELLSGLFSGSNAYALGSGILIFFMLFAAQFLSGLKRESAILNNSNRDIFLIQTRLRRFLKLASLNFLIFLIAVMVFGTIYNIISLQSRGSFLAVACSLLLWILLHEKTHKLLLYSIVGLAIAAAMVPLPENYADRITSAFAEEEERDRSTEGRLYFWGLAVQMAKDHPLGIGTGCFKGYFSSYDTTGGLYGASRSVHSSHFQILADVGYLGIIVWFSLFFVVFKRLWAIRRASRNNLPDRESSRFYFHVSNALICSMTTFFIGGAFYEYAYNDIIWLIFGITVALGRLYRIDEEKKTGDAVVLTD